MPYVRFSTTQGLSEEKRAEVRAAIWDAITELPDKSPEVTMIEIGDHADIMKGPGGTPAIFAETHLFTQAPIETKRAYAKKLFAKFGELLGVDPKNMYFNILELNEWGSGGNYKSF